MSDEQVLIAINNINISRLLRKKSGNDSDKAVLAVLLRDQTNFKMVKSYVDETSDVYRRCNPEEAVEIVGPLRQLDNRVAEFLNEFDIHPTLLSIRQVIDRVMSLTLFVPVISLCTGVEMVLSRVNDWHINAPKKYSLQTETDALWAMVVKWRKQELNEWKLILDTTITLEAQKSSTLFPEIFSAVEASIDGDLDSLRLVIINFLTTGNCANFKLGL